MIHAWQQSVIRENSLDMRPIRGQLGIYEFETIGEE